MRGMQIQGDQLTYPYRTEKEQSTLDHMPHSPYAHDDKPFLNTMRYSMSGYDSRDVADKARLDAQGAADNLHSLRKWREAA
jgi:hypothetical protein